ncbi:MAG: hypothetical protein PHV42_00320 [Candidatus Pacebacteria bacterium]|nr:hypothetical protein [Candidatus Paceibacterota bacterium]
MIKLILTIIGVLLLIVVFVFFRAYLIFGLVGIAFFVISFVAFNVDARAMFGNYKGIE